MNDCPQVSHSDPKGSSSAPLELTLISFGYKEGAAPVANLVLDVRYLKNPFWVEELRPLTGKDSAVQEYVLDQPLANELVESIMSMLDVLLPKFEKEDIRDFSVAFGCTGGQHRSATMVEVLWQKLQQRFPRYSIKRFHRELDAGVGPAKDAK